MYFSKMTTPLIALLLSNTALGLDFRVKLIESSGFTNSPAAGSGFCKHISTGNWIGCDGDVPGDCKQHTYVFEGGNPCDSSSGSNDGDGYEVCGRYFTIDGDGADCPTFLPNGQSSDAPAQGELYAHLKKNLQCVGGCYMDDNDGNPNTETCSLGSAAFYTILRCYDDGNC